MTGPPLGDPTTGRSGSAPSEIIVVVVVVEYYTYIYIFIVVGQVDRPPYRFSPATLKFFQMYLLFP